jgi:DNA-binding NarL/FixJ family response regulator
MQQAGASPSLCSAGSLKKRLFTELITDSRALSGGIDSLLEGSTRDFTAVVQYITPAGSVPSNLSCSVIRDRFGDISGFLIVSQELRTLDTFRKTYMVTGRELEVTSLVISGATYREISERLGISERTVERHLTNIYNKLGINNKIELYRMAEEYNIRM